MKVISLHLENFNTIIKKVKYLNNMVSIQWSWSLNGKLENKEKETLNCLIYVVLI